MHLGVVRTAEDCLAVALLPDNYHRNSMLVRSLLTVLTWLDLETGSVVVEFVFVVVEGPGMPPFQLVS